MQVQGRKTYAGTARSAAYHHFTGKECLDVHLLKPSRLEVITGQPDVVCADDAQQGPAQATVWLEYALRKSKPILRWLPTKLAAWIGEKLDRSSEYPPRATLS